MFGAFSFDYISGLDVGLKETQEYLFNIKNSIFNGTGPTTLKGISEAKLEAMD